MKILLLSILLTQPSVGKLDKFISSFDNFIDSVEQTQKDVDKLAKQYKTEKEKLNKKLIKAKKIRDEIILLINDK